MNKTKTWSESPTKEKRFYMREVERVCHGATQSQNIRAEFLESFCNFKQLYLSNLREI